MFKLVLEKAKEPEIKLPTCIGSSKKQESVGKLSTLLTMPKPLTVWTTTNNGIWFSHKNAWFFDIFPCYMVEPWKHVILNERSHKGIPIRITADLSIETLQARREWQDILKVMKENKLQPRLLYPARISFKYEGEIKSFTDKQKLREFSTTKPALQQILKDIL